MDWERGDGAGQYTLSVPETVGTWEGLRPYFAAMWAKLLADVPSLDPPAKPSPRLMLCVDGRQGVGQIWLVLVGGGGLAAAAADPALTVSVSVTAPGVEGLVSGAADWEAANCRLAEEVLAAVELPPALESAQAVVARHPKAAVTHDAIDPEHGWYVPFKARLADLARGKRPAVEWTFASEE
jgi:hypothetical protein